MNIPKVISTSRRMPGSSTIWATPALRSHFPNGPRLMCVTSETSWGHFLLYGQLIGTSKDFELWFLDVSWCFLMFLDVSWCFLVFLRVSWCFLYMFPQNWLSSNTSCTLNTLKYPWSSPKCSSPQFQEPFQMPKVRCSRPYCWGLEAGNSQVKPLKICLN